MKYLIAYKSRNDRVMTTKIFAENQIEAIRTFAKQKPCFEIISITVLEDEDTDKVDFAVGQLEKLRAELVNNVSPVKLCYNEYVDEVFSKIDNQIKQIKGE